MRHARPLAFDDLEARKLMTRVHHAALHAAPVVVSAPAPVAAVAPLTLNGTLAVNNKAAVVITDAYGDQTTATPVSGSLSGLGTVRGVWNESVDATGAYLGPDSIQLHNAKGSFVVGFDTTTLGQAETTPQGTVVFNAAVQQLKGGQGAYARSSETGLILVNTNARETVVESLTLSS